MRNQIITTLIGVALSFSGITTQACDKSSFAVNSVTNLGGGYYEFNVTFCVGAGQNAYAYGADQNTGTWAIVLDNGAEATSWPAFLTSPNTGAVYFGDTISYMGKQYLVYDYYSGTNGWWACIDGTCGPVQSVCIDVVFTSYGMPNSLIGGGAESAGIVVSGYGCNDEPDMLHDFNTINVFAGTDKTVCPGGTANLQATSQDGMPPFTYSWSHGATGASVTVSPATTTTYTVTITDALGATATDAVTVNVNSLPTANAGADQTKYIGYGASCLTLTGSASGGTSPYTYAWSTGATTATTSVCPTVTTNYNLTVTDAIGCSHTDAITVEVENIICGPGKVYVCHYGVTKCYKTSQVASHLTHGDYLGTCSTLRTAAEEDHIHHAGLEVFPNPAAGTASILFTLEESDFVSISCYNMNGQEVLRPLDNVFMESGEWLELLNIELLQNGLYQVVIQTSAGEIATSALMVQQ